MSAKAGMKSFFRLMSAKADMRWADQIVFAIISKSLFALLPVETRLPYSQSNQAGESRRCDIAAKLQ
jgi:hypothetical protein